MCKKFQVIHSGERFHSHVWGKTSNLSNNLAYLSHILKKGKRKATREGQFPKRRLNIMLPDATSSLPLYSFSSLSFQPAVLLLTLLSTATFASLRSLSLLLLPPPYPPPKKSRGNQEYKKRWKATGDSLITTGHFSLSRGAHLSPPSQPPRADEKQPQILSVAPLPPFFFFLSCPLLFLAALDHGSCFRLHRKTPLLRPFYACCLIRSRTTKTTSAAENLRTERERVKPSPAG